QVEASDPLAGVSGTSSIVTFRMDVLKEITIIEAGAGPDQTAYGLLADFVGSVVQ
ncbi:MAG: homoserine dehydrogenase, partial [Chloroflexi bacterium]|nr:homoserine dehydrogenase [Chloroflexota bacterium]